LQVLGRATYSCRGVETTGQTTWYTTRSGAGVFASGTLRWTCSLTRDCFGLPVSARTRAFVTRVTQNLVRGFAAGRAGERHPAVDNVDRFDLPTTNGVSAS